MNRTFLHLEGVLPCYTIDQLRSSQTNTSPRSGKRCLVMCDLRSYCPVRDSRHNSAAMSPSPVKPSSTPAVLSSAPPTTCSPAFQNSALSPHHRAIMDR